ENSYKLFCSEFCFSYALSWLLHLTVISKCHGFASYIYKELAAGIYRKLGIKHHNKCIKILLT
ncbi:MAG: hypothetical protein WC479_12385, partial [Candidatus Izemoplasmatales bacterium]